MATANHQGDVPRKRADWMRPTDDQILEHLADSNYGNLTPKAFENLGICTRGHASIRLSELRKVGFVDYVAETEGLYQITDRGRAYLDEEFDATTVNPDESE